MKARFSHLLRHPAWKQKGPIRISALHKSVTNLLNYTFVHLLTAPGPTRDPNTTKFTMEQHTRLSQCAKFHTDRWWGVDMGSYHVGFSGTQRRLSFLVKFRTFITHVATGKNILLCSAETHLWHLLSNPKPHNYNTQFAYIIVVSCSSTTYTISQLSCNHF